MITHDQLNQNQRRAADWTDGPVLVLAGPGSGKTAVLTLRVARLLEEDEKASTLSLTFTNKAATEMRERVDELLGERTDRAKLSTFHSFAIDLLGQHGSHLGIRPDFLPLSQDEDRIAVLDEVIRELPEVAGELPADRGNLLSLIDGVFGEGNAGDGASQSLASRHPWLPRLFRRYCDALVVANRPDFGSLLFFAARLLREKPMVARVVRLSWTHICVDEFQDTNRAQYDLGGAATGDNGGHEAALARIRAGLVDGFRSPQVVVDFLDGGWQSWIGDEFVKETEEEVTTWKGLHEDLAAAYGRSVPLHTYLQQLDLLSKSPSPSANALQCMTVHRAKGLEFNHVYLIGMAQEVFPSYRALQKGATSEEVEEERRSCFVAITRAQETLTMTRAGVYFGYVKGPSQFLEEMGVGP